MGELFWQAKIWGLLHDPLLKSLYENKKEEGLWNEVLEYLGNPTPSFLKNLVKEADYIAAASDRPSWDQDNRRGHIDYKGVRGLHVSHLLSGKRQSVVIDGQTDASFRQDKALNAKEAEIIRQQLFPLLEGLSSDEQHQKAYWWLWRCLPEAISHEFGDNTALLPADTRIPDCSVWSHNSSAASLAGSLVGLDKDEKSRPYLVIFTMTPVQEMIKSSRKMQDFWSGSWLLHYLSAKVSWKWAQKYGPDSLVYPSLYAQPLIDKWLVDRWPDFNTWVDEPLKESFHKRLLTAGFPNVLVAVLPEGVVHSGKGAVACAEGVLRESWLELGNKVWDKLPKKMKLGVNKERLWDEWLKHQWQTYWTALPLGNASSEPEGADALTRGQGQILTSKERNQEKLKITNDFKEKFLIWANAQNKFSQINHNYDIPQKAIDLSTATWNTSIFKDRKTCPTLAELTTYKQFNVGLWWAYIYDQLRRNLSGVKNARSWEIPSTFSPRSTISGIGPVLHPQQYNSTTREPVDWVSELETRQFWQQEQGWFSGQEQLNPTEILKRGLEKILADPDVLGIDSEITSYPDLTAGVAGYLKTQGHLEVRENLDLTRYQHFENACDHILKIQWTNDAVRPIRGKWGIPYIDDKKKPKKYHPRLIHAGWLSEDVVTQEIEDKQNQIKHNRELLEQRDNRDYAALYRQRINSLMEEITKLKADCCSDLQERISHFYPNNNPSDWYVLAVGDGDDMGKWLQGTKLQAYKAYVAEGYPDSEARKAWEGVEDFLDQPKRMGPATHAALSRALLDFSNQLVPYLTEQRYAGRLIYSGGDDVLAYTNLWEWDSWLWDVRQCFKGAQDPSAEFDETGDYWRWKKEVKGEPPDNVSPRPLFTMGHKASISFGVVIAHHSVPLAIALENLWEAEKPGAKEYDFSDGKTKDAVQVRVLYGNGNILKATAKFGSFNEWRSLLTSVQNLEPALFEQAAQVWEQHPVPLKDAIQPWVNAFCDRRDFFKGAEDSKKSFNECLVKFLKEIWKTTLEADHERDLQIQNWLKLAAFVLRKRDIQIGGV